MWARATLLWGFLAATFTVCLAGKALAELMTALFPEGVPGYDTADGVTVETRLHPEQMPLGLREDAFRFTPQLDQGLGYTSNVLPGSNRHGSWQIVTAPSLSMTSDWPRDQIGAAMSAQDTRYLSLPSQNRTDGTVSAGGRIDIGDGRLTLAASHVAAHEDPGTIDTLATDRPIAFQLDDIRASYAVAAGRWAIEPAIDVTHWTYSDTTIMGLPASQAYRDRLVTQAGVTTYYELAPLRKVLLVVRGVGQDYTRAQPNQPSLNSNSYQVLAGIDEKDDPVWRWRVLVGGEVRSFASSSYPRETRPIAEAGIGWSPSGMTTVTATFSRETEDAAQEGVSGMAYTSARLTIDHEYLRNLLFKASAGFQRADFFQGGYQTGTILGLGVTWVLDRNARLLFTYDQTDLRGSSLPAAAMVAGFSRGLGLITLRLGL